MTDAPSREALEAMAAALEAPTSRQVAERLLMGAVRMQASKEDPKGCLGVISSVACGPAAEPIRACVIERQERVRAAGAGRPK